MMPDFEGQTGGWDAVSILVVLDWTMMRLACRTKLVARAGFNPCCIGLDNDARAPACDPEHWDKFQSLLYWIGQ